MTRPVLAAVDLSPLSTPVAALAGAIARATGTSVTLLHATDRRDPEPRAAEALDVLAAPLRGSGLAVDVELAEGDPADVTLARAAGASYVVTGTHGGQGVEYLMLGSVAERILDHAPCPVATVRVGFSGALRRIVCGADLSDAAPLAAGLALARAAGAELLVLHAVRELPDDGAWDLVPASTRAGLLEEAQTGLASHLAGLDTSGVAVRTAVVPGRAHLQLVRGAAEESADLVVVGVHPHLFGSTAHHVVRSSDVPVLTVRGPVPDEESPR